jgi:quinol monooxygenase YgiN
MAAAGYTSLWEFTVPPARQAEFEAHYGPGGAWVSLFRHVAGYLGSELLQDCKDPQRYLTVDRWESIEAWRAFRSRFAADYERLDRELEGIASHESALGDYRPAGEA